MKAGWIHCRISLTQAWTLDLDFAVAKFYPSVQARTPNPSLKNNYSNRLNSSIFTLALEELTSPKSVSAAHLVLQFLDDALLMDRDPGTWLSEQDAPSESSLDGIQKIWVEDVLRLIPSPNSTSTLSTKGIFL